MAERGLRYNRFHVTALCSPTRAALLTGRNSHTVGFGSVGEFSNGFPGYTAVLPRDCAPLPRVLRDNGYSTAAFGKWHLTPDGQQGAAGPLDRWPNGWGFDYFYGFLGGGASQWDPCLAENQKIIGTDPGFYDEDNPYYLPDAMADKTIQWLHGVRAQDATKPFFAYFSTGCSHAPHHVADSWADKYKGRFDQGWDRMREEVFARQQELGVVPPDAELTPRNEAFPAWDDVPEPLKAYYARQMEVYAGFSENADHNVGRVHRRDRGAGRARQHVGHLDLGRQRRQHGGLAHRFLQRADHAERHPAHRRDAVAAGRAVRRAGRLGRGDDGPALLGGLGVGRQHAVPVGQAGRLPPRRYAQPDGRPLARPGHRRRWAALAVHPRHRPRADDPRRVRHPGARTRSTASRRSRCTASTFADSFTDAAAPERHTQQYFESVGNRAMYKDGWWLAMRTERIPWVLTPAALQPYTPGVWNPDDDPTELYYLPDDFSQAHDLAAEHPDKVEELRTLFWSEAEKYKVLPLLATLGVFFGIAPPLPKVSTFEFRGDVENVLSGMVPRIYNHSYSISADLVIPEGGAEGVIVANADHLGGFSLFVDGGRLTHTYSMMGVFVFRQQAEEQLPTGEVTVRMEFAADAPKPATGGEVTLFVNDKPVGTRTHGPHRPHPVLRLRGHGHRARQRRGRRPELRGPQAVRLHGDDQEGRVRRQAAPHGRGRARRAPGRAPRPGAPRGHRPEPIDHRRRSTAWRSTTRRSTSSSAATCPRTPRWRTTSPSSAAAATCTARSW